MFQDTGRAVRQLERRTMTGMAGAGMMLPGIMQAGGQIIINLLGVSTRIFGRREYLAYGIPAAILLTAFIFLSGLAMLSYFGLPEMILNWFGIEVEQWSLWSEINAAPVAVIPLAIMFVAPFVMYCAFYVKAHYIMNTLMMRGYQLSWWLTPIVVVCLLIWAKAEMYHPNGMLYDYIPLLELGLIIFILSLGLITLVSFFVARKWAYYSAKQKIIRMLDEPYTVEVDEAMDIALHEYRKLARKHARFRMKQWLSYMLPVCVILLGVIASQFVSLHATT